MTELFTKRTQAIVDNANHGCLLVKMSAFHSMPFLEQREIREVFQNELGGTLDTASKVWTFPKTAQREVERCLAVWNCFITQNELGHSNPKSVFAKTIFGPGIITSAPSQVIIPAKKKPLVVAKKPVTVVSAPSLVSTLSQLQKAISDFSSLTGYGRVKMKKELSALVSMNVPSQSPVFQGTIFQ